MACLNRGLPLIALHWFPLCAPVTGVLKGYDQLLNLVLDDAVEYLRGKLDDAAAAQQCPYQCMQLSSRCRQPFVDDGLVPPQLAC